MRNGRGLGLVTLGLMLGAVVASPAMADEAALALVRAEWFEGIPFDRARAVTPAGAAAIAELLADPAEAEHHAAALEVLGIAGHPGAYEAIAAWRAAAPDGPVSTAEFRARLAGLLALGHLARQDDRALRDLLGDEAQSDAAPWSYRHMDGARVRGELRRRALQGLGLSGRPAARARLAQRAADAAAPAGLRSAADEARGVGDRISRDGPDAALGGGRR